MADPARALKDICTAGGPPLIRIDGAVDWFGRAPMPSTELAERLLDCVARCVLEEKGISAEGSGLQHILRPSIPREAARLFAVSLLRLMSRGAVLDPVRVETRVQIVSLLESTLEPDLYRAIGLSRGDQGFKKVGALSEVASSVERDLTSEIESIMSVDGFLRGRQSFMRLLSRPTSAAILSPFLPRPLLRGQLDQVYLAVEEFSMEAGPRLLQAYEFALARLQDYERDAITVGTAYAALFATMAGRVARFLAEEFATSPLSQAAMCTLRAVPKRYPLNEPGRPFYVAVVVSHESGGPADHAQLSVLDSSRGIEFAPTSYYLGRLASGEFNVELRAVGVEVISEALVELQLTWANTDGSRGIAQLVDELTCQSDEIPWIDLSQRDPYSLEPVTTEQELVGRGEILASMLAKSLGGTVGSWVLWGQRRVGKTSIAKTLASEVEGREDPTYRVVYLESGAYAHPQAPQTIASLGRTLCDELQQAFPALAGVPIPEFQDALSPLDQFLRNARRAVPSLKALIVLDEFDELPGDLHRRGGVGDAFYVTLRTISGHGPFGFILVGGENMQLVLRNHGDRLNKFQAQRVDYFDREEHWLDFNELVRRPVETWLEISDEAVVRLYEATAGNPYFTKLVCSRMYEDMVGRRDSHAMGSEVSSAVAATLRTVGSNSFQHFWQDGILEPGARAEAVSIVRRKVLVALGKTIQRDSTATLEAVQSVAHSSGVTPEVTEQEVEEFTRRNVLVGEDGTLRCKVPLFERWLSERGYVDLAHSYLDREAIERYEREEERDRVKAEEIVRLVSRWDLYRGRRFTEDAIRAWLSQFEGNRAQRLMFRILEGIRFYSASAVREKVREADGIVQRQIRSRVEEGRRKRADVLISYLGGPGKSGAAFAKLYADENSILAENVVTPDILSVRAAAGGVRGIVMIDDFVGSGQSARQELSDLRATYPELADSKSPPLILVVIAAFNLGLAQVEKASSGFAAGLKVHACDRLDESDRCFSEVSRIFPESGDRSEAMRIAREYGERLDRARPLGWREGQAAVVFPDTVPNNSLPILWAESRTWTPLFPRQ